MLSLFTTLTEDVTMLRCKMTRSRVLWQRACGGRHRARQRGRAALERNVGSGAAAERRVVGRREHRSPGCGHTGGCSSQCQGLTPDACSRAAA